MRLYAEWWAAGEDQTRPELSPLYGDLTGLPPTLMFCGTLDTLYPQCRQLADRGRAQGWDLTYVEQPDLLHVYPILPVPEAKQAMATTVAFLAQTPERSR
jgi:acetyl esterase/lipase